MAKMDELQAASNWRGVVALEREALAVAREVRGVPGLAGAIFNTLGANTYTFTFIYDIDPTNLGVKASLARQTGSADFSIVVDGSETFDYSLIGFSTSA